MTKIYGIKTCGSVRKAIKFFNENNLEFEFIDFRKDPLDDSKLDFFASNIDVNKLFNNKGTKYRDLKLKELNLDDSGKLAWLKKENMLLKRPVIEYDNKALCAFDEEVYGKIFL
jgi:Spx/MgsR family transcriptional regulator